MKNNLGGIKNTMKKQVSVEGMSDNELEALCAPEYFAISPIYYWTSEIYSFGKCYRHMAHYPKFFPLFVFSDHGVALSSMMFSFELNNSANIHFTWHPDKVEKYKDCQDLKVVRVAHPWIGYRRAQGIARSDNHKGTLVFFSHHCPGIEWVGHDTEEYFETLKNLPEKYQPVVLCLHMHDINLDNHKKFRRYGFPIVTAGNSSSAAFVDRFYDLVKNFSYATSHIFGSQVAYCVELGVPYFFLGDRPKSVNISNENFPLGTELKYPVEKSITTGEALFRLPVDRVTDEQRVFVESMLGLDSQLNRRQVSWIIWREFFYHWRQWFIIPKFMLSLIFRKLGMSGVLRQLRQYFNKRKQK